MGWCIEEDFFKPVNSTVVSSFSFSGVSTCSLMSLSNIMYLSLTSRIIEVTRGFLGPILSSQMIESTHVPTKYDNFPFVKATTNQSVKDNSKIMKKFTPFSSISFFGGKNVNGRGT
jgi:hypothetical protein